MKVKVLRAVATAALTAAARWLVSPVAMRYERALLIGLSGAVIEAVRAAFGHA